jgi:hypothetical protein
MNMHQKFAPDDPYGCVQEHERGRIVPAAAREWFATQGVAPINLVKTWAGYYDLLHHDDVIFLDNGCFEFCRYREGQAKQALTFVCWSYDGVAIDICAWQALTGKLATWLGRACMLGEDNLYGPRVGAGLAVHSSPLDWFKAARDGVVILDPKRAAPMLRDAGALTVGSLEEARKLKKVLTVELPPILIPEATPA